MTPHDLLFNVVILPVTAAEATPPRFQLSASRNDHELRLLSPHWTMTELRAAFRQNGTPDLHVEQLLRGNRMVFGGRDTRKLFFTPEELLAMGLEPEPKRVPEPSAEPEPVP